MKLILRLTIWPRKFAILALTFHIKFVDFVSWALLIDVRLEVILDLFVCARLGLLLMMLQPRALLLRCVVVFVIVTEDHMFKLARFRLEDRHHLQVAILGLSLGAAADLVGFRPEALTQGRLLVMETACIP